MVELFELSPDRPFREQFPQQGSQCFELQWPMSLVASCERCGKELYKPLRLAQLRMASCPRCGNQALQPDQTRVEGGGLPSRAACTASEP